MEIFTANNLDPLFMNLIRPYYGVKLIRLGREHDGGYVLPQQTLSEASGLLSIGYGNDSSFEGDFRKFNESQNKKIVLLDDFASLRHLSLQVLRSLTSKLFKGTGHPRLDKENLIKFINLKLKGEIQYRRLKLVGSKRKSNEITLQKLIEEFVQKTSGTKAEKVKLVVKIDIEGAEYQCLSNLNNSHYLNIYCLVVEFHKIPEMLSEFKEIIKNLSGNFVLINTHINNYGEIVDGIPQVVELCFLNNSYVNGILKEAKSIPSHLDQRNCVRFPEIMFEY